MSLLLLLFHERRRFEARFRVKRFLVSQKRTFTSRVFRVSRELEKEVKKIRGKLGEEKTYLKTFGPKKVDVVVPARPRFTTQEEEEEEEEEED